MGDTRHPVPLEDAGPLSLSDRTEPGVPPGRWCPFCGADLSHVPVRDERQEEAVFAIAGRRLKTAIAVGFVVIWLVASLYDFLNDPGTNLLPGWYSALGALMLVYLLGVTPMGLLRRRGG